MNADAMDSGWYYSKQGGPPGQHVGPISWEQLVSYARSGFLTPNDLVWSPQMAGFQPAAQIPGLFPAPVSPAYGYPASFGYAPAEPRRSRLLYWLIPLIAVIVIGGGLGAYFGIWYNKGLLDLETLAFAQQEGEIFLEASGVAGPGSFTGEQFVTAAPTTTLSIPNPAITLPPTTSTTKPTTSTTQPQSPTTPAVVAQPVVVASYPGDTPALYGGSKSKLISDKEEELRFLDQNPLKAAAFCEALNSDPTLRWSGGNQVRPDQLREYFAELTPMMLTRDIRVTNYGYRNGHPTPRQSVLQAGQLVLVDRYGVPRKRCQCGNPLTPPRPSSRPPVYTGPKWPGFNPTTIIVIQQTTVIINIFTVIDIYTGQPYGRPAGTDGGQDGPPATTGTTATTATTAPPSSETTAPTTPLSTEGTGTSGPIASSQLNGTWAGTFTITDLTLDQQAAQDASDQGCSAEVLQALKGQPFQMTLQITVDQSGTSGSAVMQLDLSSLSTGDTSGGSNEPQTLPFTLDGNTLTFQLEDQGQSASAMTGVVSRQDQTLVISGTLTSSDSGSSMKATWQVTRQIAM
jgi:hypothetical protein